MHIVVISFILSLLFSAPLCNFFSFCYLSFCVLDPLEILFRINLIETFYCNFNSITFNIQAHHHPFPLLSYLSSLVTLSSFFSSMFFLSGNHRGVFDHLKQYKSISFESFMLGCLHFPSISCCKTFSKTPCECTF